jgi:hypothetical protein
MRCPSWYGHDMSDEAKESSGRTVSFWMSHDELDALAARAAAENVTRNEAARRAVRAYAEASLVD